MSFFCRFTKWKFSQRKQQDIFPTSIQHFYFFSFPKWPRINPRLAGSRQFMQEFGGLFFFFASKARVSRREQKVSVIRRNENARQWETVPGSRVPVVVCTARAICISTAKFDYVDDDEVGDIKCFPLFSFSLEHRRGREKGKDVHIHIHVSTSLRFVHLNLKFVSKFSYYFFRSPFCIYIYIYALQKFYYTNRKRISKNHDRKNEKNDL